MSTLAICTTNNIRYQCKKCSKLFINNISSLSNKKYVFELTLILRIILIDPLFYEINVLQNLCSCKGRMFGDVFSKFHQYNKVIVFHMNNF